MTTVPFIFGDVDGSHGITINDIMFLIDYIFFGGPAPDPLLAGDADCDYVVEFPDLMFILNYIFHNGGVPGCQLATYPQR